MVRIETNSKFIPILLNKTGKVTSASVAQFMPGLFLPNVIMSALL